MRGHVGEFGENGVEERGGVLGDIGGHSLQQEQHRLHWLRPEGRRDTRSKR